MKVALGSVAGLAVLVAAGVVVATVPRLSDPAPEARAVQSSRSTAPVVDRGSAPSPKSSSRTGRATRLATYPLQGVVVALDPGHQLGNHNYPRQINALVPAGGFKKACNTTGTATNSGVPEATVNFVLAHVVRARLQRLGATVRMTRNTNREDRWGPCIDARGRFGRHVGAALSVSLHADGSSSGNHGFHVIAPTRRSPWTTDIAGPSYRLARLLRNGLTAANIPRSNYIGGGTGIDVRSDLGTLNMSDVPIAMIEIGNMRNSVDAQRMTTRAGRARYATAIVSGIRAWLRR